MSLWLSKQPFEMLMTLLHSATPQKINKFYSGTEGYFLQVAKATWHKDKCCECINRWFQIKLVF